MNGLNSNTSGANVATVAYKPTVVGDQVSEAVMQELQRRLEITFEAAQSSDIWPGAQAPTDKTKIWWPIDPVTGARVGKPKVWDQTSGTWVEFGSSGTVATPQRQRRNGIQQVAAGGSVMNFDFLDIGTVNYMVTLTPIAFVDGAPIPGPGTMENFGNVLLSRSNAQFTVQFYGVPSGGLSMLWEVAEMAGQTDDEST